MSHLLLSISLVLRFLRRWQWTMAFGRRQELSLFLAKERPPTHSYQHVTGPNWLRSPSVLTSRQRLHNEIITCEMRRARTSSYHPDWLTDNRWCREIVHGSLRRRDEVWTFLINDARLNKHQSGRERLLHLLTCNFSPLQPSATSAWQLRWHSLHTWALKWQAHKCSSQVRGRAQICTLTHISNGDLAFRLLWIHVSLDLLSSKLRVMGWGKVGVRVTITRTFKPIWQWPLTS